MLALVCAQVCMHVCLSVCMCECVSVWAITSDGVSIYMCPAEAASLYGMRLSSRNLWSESCGHMCEGASMTDKENVSWLFLHSRLSGNV